MRQSSFLIKLQVLELQVLRKKDSAISAFLRDLTSFQEYKFGWTPAASANIINTKEMHRH